MCIKLYCEHSAIAIVGGQVEVGQLFIADDIIKQAFYSKVLQSAFSFFLYMFYDYIYRQWYHLDKEHNRTLWPSIVMIVRLIKLKRMKAKLVE